MKYTTGLELLIEKPKNELESKEREIRRED